MVLLFVVELLPFKDFLWRVACENMACCYKVSMYLLLLMLINDATICSRASGSACIAKEREALIDLKNVGKHLRGLQWNMGNEDCCKWAGIQCDEATGQVTAIELTLGEVLDEYGAPLEDCGPLPSSLANLSALQTLDLSGSCFSLFPSAIFPALTHLDLSSSLLTSLPPHLCSLMPRLTYLDLSLTLLTSLPPHLGSLPRLTYLDISDCDSLEGTIPPQWGNLSRLQYLELGGSSVPWNLTNFNYCSWPNSLTHLGISGNFYVLTTAFSSLSSCLQQVIRNLKYLDMSFPRSTAYDALQSLLIQATNLTELVLSATDLNPSVNKSTATWSRIPEWLRVVGPRLQTFNVSGCQIQGDVHPTWFRENMLKLRDFDASSNSLTGPLASLLSPNMSGLEHLDLSHNDMNGDISVLALSNASSHLQFLSLAGNSFSGNPFAFASSSKWSSLTHLDLSFNSFSGNHFPLASSSKWSSLSYLDLSSNHFSGSAPDWVGNMSLLTHLGLSSNRFNCGIPASLGRLRNLQYLDLSQNNLEGQLPTSFRNLTGLRTLDLSSNQLGGAIPDALCNVSTKSALYAVSLSANQFVGTIPTCLLSRIAAQYVGLDISHNLQLSGSLPRSVWSGLITGTPNLYSYYLDFSHNQISGSLPASITYNQTSDVFVDASHNKLSGSLPSNIAQNCLDGDFEWYASHNFLSGQLLPSFIDNITCSPMDRGYATIALQNNLLSGIIPESLGFLSGLKYLSLAGNDLSGNIPASMANATALQFFDANYNKLKGQIPNFGDGTPYLWALMLRENELHGIIPLSVANLSNLVILDVSNNQLSGIIPFTQFITRNTSLRVAQRVDIANHSRWSAWRLKQIIDNNGNVDVMGSPLYMASDVFNSGYISLSVGFFCLNVSHNMLSGSIPKGLANISTLEWLDLSNNQLTGTIPMELLQLTFLSIFNVSYNPRLEGPIPQGAQFSIFTNDSFYGDPRLCGPPLSKACSCSDLVGPPKEDPTKATGANSSLLSRIQEEVSLEAVGIGYAIGFVVVVYMINSFVIEGASSLLKKVARLMYPNVVAC